MMDWCTLWTVHNADHNVLFIGAAKAGQIRARVGGFEHLPLDEQQRQHGDLQCHDRGERRGEQRQGGEQGQGAFFRGVSIGREDRGTVVSGTGDGGV